MKHTPFFLLLSTLLLLAACKTTQKTVAPEFPQEVITDVYEGPAFDKLSDLDLLPPYQPSYERTHNLLHTVLDLRFDMDKMHVLGKATLTLQPLFYASNELKLDAENFVFSRIGLAGGPDLKYTYNDAVLTIALDKTYTRAETYRIEIIYTARPEDGEVGGSAAITSEKGLFFINSKGQEPDKPTQIWSQGETENNSRWFPTIDKPNERMTTDITLTVPAKMKTLSNGLMTSTLTNADGSHTDKWVMDQPHAPYLVMIAVGDFAVVKDKWNGIEVSYYVEPAFEPYAKDIFPYTTEMLQFFSDKLKTPYPWQKYSQIIVRDYVSGAMENTTAVIFGEYMQAESGDLIDVEVNELVVAHEMFHHWFGDLVTCESWSNLTLNEGFANYSEYLWLEHKHGKDRAEAHRISERQGYMGQARNNAHPLIHFNFTDKEDMFDAHSYNKGGLVLHMLRNYVGDDAFFASLSYYLEKNKYTEVEVEELRLAFEDITGKDLHWFFDQWYLKSGHPNLKITPTYMEAEGAYRLEVEQTQKGDMDVPDVFQFPVDILIVNADGSRRTERVFVKNRTETFTFNVGAQPQLVSFDPERVVLASYTEAELSLADAAIQYKVNPALFSRFQVLQSLPYEADKPLLEAPLTSSATQQLIAAGFSDGHPGNRGVAIEKMFSRDPAMLQQLANLAAKDPHADVRLLAFQKLAELKDKSYSALFQKGIETDVANSVRMAALNALGQMDAPAALQSATKLENSSSSNILVGLSDFYSEQKSVDRIPFFEKNIAKIGNANRVNFLINYAMVVKNADPAQREKSMDWLLTQMKSSSIGTKLGAFGALSFLNESNTDLVSSERVTAQLQALLDGEKKPGLREAMQQIQAMMIMMNETTEE